MTSPSPHRAAVRQMLIDLIDGVLSEEQASDWASAWVLADTPEVDDPVVWAALEALSGADLKIGPTEHLHTRADFVLWLQAFDDGELRQPEQGG